MEKKEEILDAIDRDDGTGDAYGDACDWLSDVFGGDYDGSYTRESIRAAVERGDPDLLESC